MKRFQVKRPTATTLSGPKPSGTTTLFTGTKPPKLRYRPGDSLEWEGKTHVINHVYRLKDNPAEWIYVLEEVRDQNRIGALLDGLDCGKDTPRIVWHCFRDSMDAMQFFADIPCNGDRTHVSNKRLLQHLRSTNQVVTKDKSEAF